MLSAAGFDLTHFPRRNSTVTFHFNKALCSFFPLYSTHSNLIHLIMWPVTMVAMNPAAEIQKTDKKVAFLPSTHPDKVRFFVCLDDKLNLNIFLLLTQLREQEKKKKKEEQRYKHRRCPKHCDQLMK